MTAPLPAPGAVQARFDYTVESRGVSFSLFYGDTHTLEYSTTDCHDLAVALLAAWDADVFPQLSNHCAGTTVTVTDLFSNTAPREFTDSSHTGGVATEPVPINVAAVIKRVQDRRYRGGKSHIYIAGYPDSRRSSDSMWDNAAITNLATGIDDLDTAAAGLTTSHGDPWVPIAVSRFDHGVERGSPVFFRIVSDQPQTRICTRRRRLPKIVG